MMQDYKIMSQSYRFSLRMELLFFGLACFDAAGVDGALGLA